MAKIALCIIATENYIGFVGPLIESADKYFLKGHQVDYHVFSNKVVISRTQPFYRSIIGHHVEHEPWPAMTLNRYKIMTEADLSGYQYVFYIDADMLFVGNVGSEVLADLVGVIHPGYYKGGGAWETNDKSKAFVPEEKRVKYIAGGFQGGRRYLGACMFLLISIEDDKKKNIKAEWNDESHWNRVFAYYPFSFTLLPPAYCMVEDKQKRKDWGIDGLNPKILALDKDHKKYQK